LPSSRGDTDSAAVKCSAPTVWCHVLLGKLPDLSPAQRFRHGFAGHGLTLADVGGRLPTGPLELEPE